MNWFELVLFEGEYFINKKSFLPTCDYLVFRPCLFQCPVIIFIKVQSITISAKIVHFIHDNKPPHQCEISWCYFMQKGWLVGCDLTSHSAIFQLYSDGTVVQFQKLHLLRDTQRHGQLGAFRLPSLPWHGQRDVRSHQRVRARWGYAGNRTGISRSTVQPATSTPPRRATRGFVLSLIVVYLGLQICPLPSVVKSHYAILSKQQSQIMPCYQKDQNECHKVVDLGVIWNCYVIKSLSQTGVIFMSLIEWSGKGHIVLSCLSVCRQLKTSLNLLKR